MAEELSSPSAWERWLDALEPGGEEAHRADYRTWLHQCVRTSARPGRLLEVALRDATIAETIDLCTPLLRRNDWDAGHAIELLRTRPEVPALPEVAALLARLSLTKDHPFAAMHACAYLIERGLELPLALKRFDAWSTLEQAKGYGGNPMGSDFAIFALQHLPDRAMPLVRRTLRSSTPMCVMEIASLLAAIDQPWCHRELAAALAEPRHAARAYLAAALRSTSSELGRRRADNAPRSGPRAPDAIGYTFEEVLEVRADDDVGGELDKWREVAGVLRERYPADWT